MRINGTTIPNFAVIPVIMGLVWFGGLSYQVNANDTEIKKQAQTPVRLAKIELTLEGQKEAIKELKEELKATAKEQSETMKLILEAVKR